MPLETFAGGIGLCDCGRHLHGGRFHAQLLRRMHSRVLQLDRLQWQKRDLRQKLALQMPSGRGCMLQNWLPDGGIWCQCHSCIGEARQGHSHMRLDSAGTRRLKGAATSGARPRRRPPIPIGGRGRGRGRTAACAAEAGCWTPVPTATLPVMGATRLPGQQDTTRESRDPALLLAGVGLHLLHVGEDDGCRQLRASTRCAGGPL